MNLVMPQFAAPSFIWTGVWVFIGIIGLVLLILLFNFFGIWIRAWVSGAYVGLIELAAMRLRSVPVGLVVDNYMNARKSGLDITVDQLNVHFLAGGDVQMVVRALIAAQKASIHLEFDRACAIDLATKGTGKTVLDAVKTSVNPKVIDCPNPASGKTTIDAVAKDGIRLLVKARVTVRANLARLVGGATEDTIIARVGQGIVSAIGSSPSYKNVLENPDDISKKVLNSGLDSQTAFEIVSIDIADVSVAGVSGAREVANVGALLETERAEADKKLRQAEAEGRRATAVAAEQENRALIQAKQADVVAAQAEIPKAIANAMKEGKLGVMDYLRMQNIMADTSMRESLAEGEKPPQA